MTQKLPLTVLLFAALFLLFCLTFYIYYQGVTPFFILDDVAHLQELSTIKEDKSLNNYISYIFNNPIVHNRRQFSYFTFALQANAWPNATNFKLLNIGLHLVNGLLVFLLTLRLLQLLAGQLERKSAVLIALVCSAMWLLSPIQTSTTLYVIQRMAMLSTFFVLSGLLIYTYSISANTNRKLRIVYMYGAFGLCLLLGVFSKENAILLCLYTIIVDFFINHPLQRQRWYRIWKLIFLYLPLSILFSYFVKIYFDGYFSFSDRPFTLMERFFTELRIITDYIRMIIIPGNYHYTLFYENYPLSRDLTTPLSTLFSGLAIALSIALAFILRRQYPLAGLGILLFFSAHMLESTILPLELYFEHRNYFAGFGIALVFSSLIAYVQSKRIKPFVMIGLVLWLVLAATITYVQANIWASPVKQAYNWYIKNPQSHRAHGHYARMFLKLKLFDEAAEFYKTTINEFQDDPTKYLLWWELQCYHPVNNQPDRQKLLDVAQYGKLYNETSTILISLLTQKENGQCQAIDDRLLLQTLENFSMNENYSNTRATMLILMARLTQLHKDWKSTALYLSKVQEIAKNRLDVLVSLTENHLFLNEYDKALAYFNILKEKCAKFNLDCLKYKEEIKYLDQLFERYNKIHNTTQPKRDALKE